MGNVVHEVHGGDGLRRIKGTAAGRNFMKAFIREKKIRNGLILNKKCE